MCECVFLFSNVVVLLEIWLVRHHWEFVKYLCRIGLCILVYNLKQIIYDILGMWFIKYIFNIVIVTNNTIIVGKGNEAFGSHSQ